MIGTDAYHITISSAPLDYRQLPIEITSIDMPSTSAATEPVKGKFLGDGVVRLFREFESDPLKPPQTASTPGDDTMVAIVALPTYFSAPDLLEFIGPFCPDITHIRIIKSESASRYIVLIKLVDVLKTAQFHHHFNGKPFNAMEPETCLVVFVKKVVFELEKRESKDLIPFLLQDPFTTVKDSVGSSAVPILLPPIVEDGIEGLSSSAGVKNLKPTLVELPTCPVCLERMDSAVTGLLTIPCQHTFHCQCLSKWSDDTCPVCRYSHPKRNAGTIANAEHCTECSATEKLWICLICGNVGCDRYAPEQHSLKHFETTGHCFAMELDTSRVWDYAGDNYVHRLLANESDGKIVELPEKDGSAGKSTSNSDKVDQVGFEYSQLLISQLASQREYYEGLLEERAAPKSRRGSSLADSLSKNLDLKVQELTDKVNVLTDKLIPGLKCKIQLKDEKISTLSKEVNQLNMLNEGLSQKVDYLQDENKQLKQSNEDLSEQVKDLMFFLESREKFKDEPDDVKEGTVVMQKKTKKKRK